MKIHGQLTRHISWVYTVDMKFEWDEEKALKNVTDHGVWFEEAQTVWADTGASEYYDEHHSDHEDRFLKVGYSTKQNCLFVVFCEREGDVIRIISARKATKNEVNAHLDERYGLGSLGVDSSIE